MTRTNKKTTKKTVKTTPKAVEALHKGFRAYIGLFGTAYERLQPVVKNVTKTYDELADKGEKIEDNAVSLTRQARELATKRLEKRTAQLKTFLPKAANDRVAELEAEIARLNKKLATKAKKTGRTTAKRATKVANKAAETVKAA